MQLRKIALVAALTCLSCSVLPSRSLAAPAPQSTAAERKIYLGTWQRQVTDATGTTRITLQIREDGTYTKTLDASLKGKSFHGSEQGSWAANGPLVLLSGDSQFPASRHDLRNYKKIA